MYLGLMCPTELDIKDTTESNISAPYLDLFPFIGDGQLRTSLYDKRDNFNITTFPFLSSNVPSSLAYGVFISQLIRHTIYRACSSYECFSFEFLGQGSLGSLKPPFRKFDTGILSNYM